MTETLIKVNGLSKRFSNKSVLGNVNLSMIKGRNLAIIGRSGEGKSVLLKCILGLIDRDNGEIRFKGTVINDRTKSSLFENLGVLFQGSALFDSMNIWENITFKYKYNRQLLKCDRKDLAIQKLELVGLSPEVADLFPSEISGGMQKRVGLARAIATNPTVLFFDEPTAGLDPIMASTINKLIKNIITKLGATALTISHDIASINIIADDVALLQEGRIAWTGGIEDFKSTKDSNIRKFLSAN